MFILSHYTCNYNLIFHIKQKSIIMDPEEYKEELDAALPDFAAANDFPDILSGLSTPVISQSDIDRQEALEKEYATTA